MTIEPRARDARRDIRVLSPASRRPSLRTGLVLAALVFAVCAAGPASAQTIWPSERPPRPLAARKVGFPTYEIRTLANGMQVVVVLQHEQPAVSMRLIVRAGSAEDPADKPGIAMLVAALLDQGTTTRSAQQIADQIDYIGGAEGTGAGSDLSFVNMVVMKDDFGTGMDLLADIVRHPAFAQEEIDRQREQALSTLKVSSEDPDYLASVVFDRLVYGFHPYGLPNTGTSESLLAISRDDVVAFHRRHFVPNNVILGIVGDVSAAGAFAGAERVFGTWPKQDLPALTFPDPPPPTRRVIAIDKPDAVQTEIRVGHIALPRRHPDYMALDLATKILGGEGANRLHRVLRSERGLTYGASADFETLKQSGDIVAETDTRSETTGEALRLIVDEITKLQRERVDDRELADAQAYLAGHFPLTIETPDQIATQVLNAVFYELPLEELQDYRERVQAVTPDDIQRVARLYFRPDRLSVVLVGNVATFGPQLRGVGFPQYEVVELPDLDLMSVDFKRGVKAGGGRGGGSDRRRRAAAPREASPLPRPSHAVAGGLRAAYTGSAASATAQTRPSVDPKAHDVIARAIEAKGGLARLRAITSTIAEADTVLSTPQGPIPSTSRTTIVYPDRYRVDAAVQEVELTQVYNRGAAWMQDPRGLRDAPTGMIEDMAVSVRRDAVPLLLAAYDGKYGLRLVDEEGADGRVQRIVEISGPGLSPLRLYVDAAGLITRQSYTVRGAAGVPGSEGAPAPRESTVDEVFSEYRAVDGVQVAFKAELRRDGTPIVERTVKSIRFNEPVDPAVFEKPQQGR